MSTRLVDDLARLACPLCSENSGLALALRLELETEREVVIAACRNCNRLYEVSPGGELRFEAGELKALQCQMVRCPACGSEGYAVSYALPEAQAESHRVLTCGECGHTFVPDPAGESADLEWKA